MTALSSSHDAHLGKIDGYRSALFVSCALTLFHSRASGFLLLSLPFRPSGHFPPYTHSFLSSFRSRPLGWKIKFAPRSGELRRIFTKNTATVPSNATATGLSVLACGQTGLSVLACGPAHKECAGGAQGECASGKLAIDDIVACARVYVRIHTPTHSLALSCT
jgi:hypothetical protein